MIDYNEPLPFFVYGTLRPGCHNDHCWEGLADAEHDGAATIDGYALIGRGIPFACPTEGAVTVGALIVPHEGSWRAACDRMDRLEGFHPSDDGGPARGYGYWRTPVIVSTPDGDVEAWVYACPGMTWTEAEAIPGNDFKTYERTWR